MSKGRYIPAPPRNKWFIVKRGEQSGGDYKETTYVIRATTSAQALNMAMSQPTTYGYTDIISACITDRNITVLDYGEDEAKEA